MKIFTKSKLMIVALAISSFTKAQTFEGGVMGGANLSNLSGVKDATKGIENATSSTGLAQGIFMRYDANAKWAVSFAVLNSPKGAKYTGKVSVTDTLNKVTGESTYNYVDAINYFELPLLVHYKFASAESKLKPYVSLGFSSAIRYNAKTTVDYSFTGTKAGKDSTYTSSIELGNYYSRSNIDYSLVGGAGLTYDITSKFILGLDARYSFGLVDLRENKIADLSQKNSTISVFLTLGYRFWNDASSSNEKPTESK